MPNNCQHSTCTDEAVQLISYFNYLVHYLTNNYVLLHCMLYVTCYMLPVICYLVSCILYTNKVCKGREFIIYYYTIGKDHRTDSHVVWDYNWVVVHL